MGFNSAFKGLNCDLYIFLRLKLAVNLSMYNDEITLQDQLHAALADFK